MEKEINNKMKISQLQDQKLTQIHKEELGLNLPEDYFNQSKNEILSKTSQDKSLTINWFLRKNSIWKVAASIVLILGLVVYVQFSANSISGTDASSIALVNNSDEINQSVVQSDSNQGNTNLESVISNTNKHIEHQKTNADNVVQNENDILVKSLFVEEAEVDKYIESSILEDI